MRGDIKVAPLVIAERAARRAGRRRHHAQQFFSLAPEQLPIRRGQESLPQLPFVAEASARV